MIKLKDILLSEAPARVNGKWGYLDTVTKKHTDTNDDSPANIRLKEEEEDYRGQHTAPTKEDAPLYDLTKAGVYPPDFYSGDIARNYGDEGGGSRDNESVSIIRSCKGKPNAKVKIYRAVPNTNKDLEQEKKGYDFFLWYHSKFNFFPMDDKVPEKEWITRFKPIQAKYEKLPISYDEKHKKILTDLEQKSDELDAKLKKSKKITINKGDWVTINKQYAIEHGKGNLNNSYKILVKTVPAKYVFTDGNSIHEWGYDPT